MPEYQTVFWHTDDHMVDKYMCSEERNRLAPQHTKNATMGIVNKGNVSEGILGCALIAKFAARTDSHIGKISSVDLANVWGKLKSNRIRSGVKEYSEHVFDLRRSAKDSIRIMVRLGPQTAKDLFSQNALVEMRDIVNSACSYVNSRPVEEQAVEFFTNMVDDKIEIEVDGISANGSSKADIVIKDNAIAIAQLSVKSGFKSQTMGQVGGDTFATFVRLFHGGPHPRTGVLEPGLGLHVNTPAIEDEYNRLRGPERRKETLQVATTFLYHKAVELLNAETPGTLLANLQKFLKFHSSRSDQNIRVVILEQIVGGRHKVLNPQLLNVAAKKLKNVRATMKSGAWPTILIYSGEPTPQTQFGKNVLFAIRVAFDSGLNKMSNLVEKGPLLDALLEDADGPFASKSTPSRQGQLLPPDQQVREWNARSVARSPVVYWPGPTKKGSGKKGYAKGRAKILNGAAVVAIEGIAGMVPLTLVDRVA